MSLEKVVPVKVAVRCRPLIPKESSEGCVACLVFVPDEPQIVVGKDRMFTYDYVFNYNDQQADVYDTAVSSLVKNIFKGLNATVLAYGQTGSGKTYTMGGSFEESAQDKEMIGMIPRVLQDIFKGIDEERDFEFTTRVSYLEIYNEEIHDLLCSSSKREALGIREDAMGGVKIPGLTEITVRGYSETMQYLSQGIQSRTTGSTAMNLYSSRSHAIFTLHTEKKKKDDLSDFCEAKFHLVDLAGSERAKRTMAEGERFKEGISINRGLLSLGNVISALGEESQKKGHTHIPYRDSKLTRLLQTSLGGNSHTLMIACISPADSNMEETLNTLRYADRARKIKNKPVVNRDPKLAEIMSLKQEIEQLRLKLGSTSPRSFPNQSYEKVLEQNRQLEEENEKLSVELQQCVDQNARKMEQMIVLEAKNEKLKNRLNEIQKQTGWDMDLLSSSINLDNHPQVKKQLEMIKHLQENIKTAQEADEIEEDLYEENTPEQEIEPAVPYTPESRTIQTQHILRQAAMGRELEELTRLLTRKEQLASRMCLSDETMKMMKHQYEENMRELEKEVFSLQNEKETLQSALENAKINSATNKISEQRRKRLQELEMLISELRKKMHEQDKLLKFKNQSDKQVLKLNSDIQNLKQNRVKLMRDMREDKENFIKWKRRKDKEVLQLMQKDRKRQFEMKKLQHAHECQQIVLKRKAEEAASVNKRLKEALSKQKVVREERSKMLDKYDASSLGAKIKNWICQELDTRVNVEEAKYHLQSLLQDRKELSGQLAALRDKLHCGASPAKKMACMSSDSDDNQIDCSSEEGNVEDQIKGLEQEIMFRTAQISDLQQKVLDADQDKGKSIWESLHTMMEAKYALKWLFEQAISAKMDNGATKVQLKESQVTSEVFNKVVEKFSEEKKTMRQKHEEEKTKLQRRHQDKVLYLLRQLKRETGEDPNVTIDEEMRKRMELQDEELQKIPMLHKELVKVKEECEKLRKEKKTGNVKKILHVESETFSDTSISEDDKDEDWTETPYVRRTKAKFQKNRKSCSCKSSCATRICSCKKKNKSCSDQCQCKEKCVNRYGPDSNQENSLNENKHNTTFCLENNSETDCTHPLEVGGMKKVLHPSNSSFEDFSSGSRAIKTLAEKVVIKKPLFNTRASYFAPP